MNNEQFIGGYFEWEFPPCKKFSLHPNALFLNSGRHALEYILAGLQDIKKLWIPYFTCDVILQPLKQLNIPYSFYHINEDLELLDFLELKKSEYILYTNYYGIKDFYVKKLIRYYGKYLIVDNAQALFCQATASHQIYSPRKFMGMPDGGIAVTSIKNYINTLPTDVSFNRCLHLLKRVETNPSEGYLDFKENGKKLAKVPLSQMSNISKNILLSNDLNLIRRRRKMNFKFLHQALQKNNLMNIPCLDSFAAPLVYPYRTNNLDLKKELLNENIFIATYWPNIFSWLKKGDPEYCLTESVICLPIDQRYTTKHMKRIIQCISQRL